MFRCLYGFDLSFSKTGKNLLCSQMVILQMGREYCQFDLSYRTSPRSTDGVAVAGASGGPISIPSLGRVVDGKVKREINRSTVTSLLRNS